MAAFFRAQHHLYDTPKILDDPFAHRLITTSELEGMAEIFLPPDATFTSPEERSALILETIRTTTTAGFVLTRARYTEDRLAHALARGVGQYVLLGAGLDTFAFRRSDLGDRLRVFELDHPTSQASKRERVALAGLAEPSHLHFGAIDFETEQIADVLRRLPFDFDRPAVFAWLGVTAYLTQSAIDATWRSLRQATAKGSELIFDFIAPTALSGDARALAAQVRARTRAVGEPMIGAIDPAKLAERLAATGWHLLEHLERSELHRRYFTGRTDGLALVPGHLAAASPV